MSNLSILALDLDQISFAMSHCSGLGQLPDPLDAVHPIRLPQSARPACDVSAEKVPPQPNPTSARPLCQVEETILDTRPSYVSEGIVSRVIRNSLFATIPARPLTPDDDTLSPQGV